MNVPHVVLVQGCKQFNASNPHAKGGSEAALYEVTRDGEKHLLRFSPVQQDEEDRFKARWDFVHYLSCSGVHVATQIPSVSDNIIEWIDDPSRRQRWALVCVKWVEGNNLDPRFLSSAPHEVLFSWGALMGRMHALAKEYPETNDLGGWREETHAFIEWCEDEYVREKWGELVGHLETLPCDKDNYGLVHNDLHSANILVSGNTVTAVDFDVCGYHWFMCDIAIAMQGALWTTARGVVVESGPFMSVFRSFMDGYHSENALEPWWEQYLETFLRYRRLLLYTVFSNEWRRPGGWQRRRLDIWHGGIIGDVPIIG